MALKCLPGCAVSFPTHEYDFQDRNLFWPLVPPPAPNVENPEHKKKSCDLSLQVSGISSLILPYE